MGAAIRKEGDKNAEMIELFSGEVDRLLGVIEGVLSDGREFLAGPYSIGDIMHYPWLKIGLDLGLPAIKDRARVVEWLERIGERPAVTKGMAVPS